MKPKQKRISHKKVLKGEQFIQALELPKEVVMNIPIITLTGSTDVSVENFIGIIEYDNERIKINTKCGTLVIDGNNLEAKSMTSEVIAIKGSIISLSFVV